VPSVKVAAKRFPILVESASSEDTSRLFLEYLDTVIARR
jgi:hypothetical protein